MAKKQRSETTWLSPKREIRPKSKWDKAEVLENEGERYVLKHASEEPITIRLCVGGSNKALDVAAIDALISDLQDARDVIAPKVAEVLHPHGGFLDGGAYDK